MLPNSVNHSWNERERKKDYLVVEEKSLTLVQEPQPKMSLGKLQLPRYVKNRFQLVLFPLYTDFGREKKGFFVLIMIMITAHDSACVLME